MSFIPRGSLAFSGFGDAAMQFLSPSGGNLGVPASAPSTPPNCNGLLAFTSAHIAAIAVYGFGGDAGIRVFNSDFTLHAGFPTTYPISPAPVPLDSDATSSIARDDAGHFYGVGSGEPATLYQYNASGYLTGWSGLDLHGGGTSNIPICAVNGAGTIGYYAPFIATGTHRPTTVYAWSLAGAGSDLGTFASEAGFDLLGRNSLLALSNGEVLIGWRKASTPGFVKHYSAAGALLHTYTLPTASPTGIPAGSLVFSGYGDASMKFHSPTGVDLGHPSSGAVECGAGTDGVICLATNGQLCVVGGNTPHFGTTGIGIFSTDFATSVEGAAGTHGFPGSSIARDDSGRFYGVKSSSPGRIMRYTAAGAQTADLAIGNSPIAVAVNGAGTIAYYVLSGSTATVRAWDLAGNTDLGTFITRATYSVAHNGLLALSNGEVLIGWKKAATAGDITHYSAAGSVLHTYTLPGTNPSPVVLTPGLDDTTIWVGYYNDAATTFSAITIAEVELGTGTIRHTFDPDDGAGFEYDGSFCVSRVPTGTAATAPIVLTPGATDGSFWLSYYDAALSTHSGVTIAEIRIADGALLHAFSPDNGSFEFDGPFCVIPADIGAPVTGPPPDPKPSIPTVACLPSTSVLSSPSHNAGCNQGGTGFTASYTGASGSVPVAADPDDGEPLTGKRSVHVWAEVTHTAYPSGVTETLRYAMTDLDDVLRKEGRLLSIGDVEHAFSDGQGNLEAATIDVTISDVPGRPIGTRLAGATTKFFQRDEITVFAISDQGRRTNATPRRLGRVLLQDAQYGSPGTAKFSGTDAFFCDAGAFGPDKTIPSWTVPAYYVNAPADVYAKYLPIILGEVSDEGAIDPVSNLPSSRGLCPLTYVGMDGLATGPGGSAELWGRFNLCLFASYQIISLYGSNLGGGLYGRANATSDGADNSVITLGGSPDLSGVAVDETVSITLYTLKGRQVSQISAVSGSTVTVKNKIDAADATNVDWIIGEQTPDRTRIDLATRNGQDVMVFGYPNYVRTTPYEDIMGSDGEVYRVTDLWIRGPLLDDHLAGIVTLAVNAIGVEDKGDGTGLPLTDYFVAMNWAMENLVVVNSKMPKGPGQLWPQTDGSLSTYADGVPKVRGSSFVDAQARTVTAFGGRGLQVSAYFGEPLAVRDFVALWNDNGWCRTGINEHGQICVLKLNLYDDPATWPRIEHVSRIFGPVTCTNPQTEIENVVRGQCDWDPDFARFRNALVTRTDADAIDHNKTVRKISKVIDGKLTRDPLQLQFILDERLVYAKDGPSYVALQGDLGLADYPLGSGVLLTTIMGPGASGFIDQPVIVLKKRFAVDSHLVTLTCLAPTLLTPPDFDYTVTYTMATGLTLLQLGDFARNKYWGGDENVGMKAAAVWDAFNQSDGVEIDNSGNQISGLSGVVVRVRVRLRVEDASISLTPRIYNVTDSAVATTSGAAACSATATDFSGSNQQQTLTLTLASGKKKYKLQLTPSAATFQGWASGIVSDIYVP